MKTHRAGPGLLRGLSPLLRGADKLLDTASETVADASRTVKFLRGKSAFQARPDDIYIASYPRSGTTWTQAITYLLVSGESNFDFEHLAEVSPWWERSLAWRTDSADRFATLAGPRMFKSHLPRRWLPNTGRILYIERDAGDVARSYYRLYRGYLGYQGSFADFLERFRRGQVQYGSWSRHLAGWHACRGEPGILFLRYEDLRANTGHVVGQIAGFLGLSVSEERIGAIVAAAGIDRMKREEDKFDHAGELLRQLGVKPGNFLGPNGHNGSTNALLSADDRQRLVKELGRSFWFPQVEWRLPAFLR